MAVKPRDVRGMNVDDRRKLLTETRAELMHERGLAAMGGSVKNPGKIRDLRTTIARVLTVEHELARGAAAPKATARPARAAQAPATKARAKAPAKPRAKAPAKGGAKGGAKGAKSGGP